MDDRTKALIEELRAEIRRLTERIGLLEQENRRLREELAQVTLLGKNFGNFWCRIVAALL